MNKVKKDQKFKVFLDLEYCYPGMTKAKGRPSTKEKRQVVQIAASLFDLTTGKEVDSFNQLVHPAFEKELPAFFKQLTGITQPMIDRQAITFSVALKKLVRFCRQYPIWTFNADRGVLKQNCEYFKIPFPFGKRPFVQVKSRLAGWNINPEKYSSGTLHKAVGIKMNGHAHNALHDVRSMGSAVFHLQTNGNQSI